jgi:non-ribosomal peptide synthetase component F
MIEDAKPAVILTAEGPSATDYTDQSHGSDPDPRNPCYVIYTSGSTGRPKAVVMPHRAAVNLINYQIQSSGHEGRLRTLQFASLSFDVSFQEIFSTLCAGGSLVLRSDCFFRLSLYSIWLRRQTGRSTCLRVCAR